MELVMQIIGVWLLIAIGLVSWHLYNLLKE